MYLIDQHTKAIMEECKRHSIAAGLKFDDETLEYIVTNKDMVDLSPKVMIPTLYDYWVNDVEVLKGHGKYKLYPHNPYETVINTRPAISFYNDNNPDWMNVMIFYHVLGHIDFFQNNILFEHTWNDDFLGQALADKRLINSLRSSHGRWVDYVIEFSRAIDNLAGYFPKIAKLNYNQHLEPGKKLQYYFDIFLQEVERVQPIVYYNEVERYNDLFEKNPDTAEASFFSDLKLKYPELQSKFESYISNKQPEHTDIIEFIRDNSPFLRKEENRWMQSIMEIIRNTSLYFQPQIRSKIVNEGWASYWHDKLFRQDKRIVGHEVGYAKLNAGVTSLRRVGLNPYAIGLRLLQYIEDLGNKGKISREFQMLKGITQREEFDKNLGEGQKAIFSVRKHFSDFMMINSFVNQDFVDRYDLFVVGQRQNPQRGTIEYYVKSRKAEDYKKMLVDSLYHPPVVSVNTDKTNDKNLYLVHQFEGKQLIQGFIPEVLIGLEFLWGNQVQFETTEIVVTRDRNQKPSYSHRKVLYQVKDRKVTKANL